MTAFFEHHGVLGLFLLSFCEASFFPLAPDFMLAPMAWKTPERALALALLATLGSGAGSLFGYALGRFGGRPLRLRFATSEKIASVEAVFRRYGVWGVALAGFAPLPYKLFTIASGVCRLEVVPFFVAGVVSRGLRFVLVAALGRAYGGHVRDNLNAIGGTLVGLCAVGIGVWFFVRWRRTRAQQTGREADPAAECDD
ncbi:MAG: hypothetical protein COZ06_29420 [Armatimonadetes bacterium CG_4_10_14_3_um_filter_66_18]|nr:DedA family protein [Armatimonadota bacterium]OIP01811.1 MAG: hypothetical protein AUJ96_17095 [Armatimonadetes bacterium CG2_30_66_41]PIU93823.1 MAG: hypothetical protein COS65_10755 [Armatimonadetes bacterium CG06_land_8_20_14_3_00_66_21]PIW20789.1 MAG: hypothetical protein COW34_01020 [Armatimonadetes bacterium CG17_big_fil_post_rev_8_21_14_2_50_66_6]PIX37419.1 MAG: hypothetical protein COZ57_34450 [Armatimonadetes bacterium CG_4_8_14_3_um_filter_66_20]PIY39564.1 MAG: hypothetical protei